MARGGLLESLEIGVDITLKRCDEVVERVFTCGRELRVEELSNSDISYTDQSCSSTSPMQPRPLSVAGTLSEEATLEKSGDVVLPFARHIALVMILFKRRSLLSYRVLYAVS
ncbi:hypothetical protein BW685_00025 [Burkholderia ubonensis]|uniref:Uncharacterized protein n=1 Tax=Burkholderia ubonensis TaxID=101571 RepID=A0A1R1JIV0_9BURK|nr:hypothetical protein BW685_00025 [Burkholderia ubonensis]